MKNLKHICVLVPALLAFVPPPLSAENVSNYTVDFNTKIDVSDHAFKIAPNWQHVVGKYTDDYGFDYYMAYSYKETGGRSGGYLYCPKQEAGDNWDNGPVTDYLITPVVSGDVTIYAKADRKSADSYVDVLKVAADGTVSGTDRWVKYTATHATLTLSTTEWTPVTIHLDEPQRIAYRMSYVNIDDFSATTAVIEAEAAMKIVSAEPSATSGVLYWDQLPDGSVEVKFTVTVANTGETDLAQGDDNFSVSIFNGATGDVYGTTPVPCNLAKGATSEPFEVTAKIADPKQVWSYSGAQVKLYLRENISGTTVQRANSCYNEYKSRFVFRKAGTTTTSNLSGTQEFGMVSAPATLNYEIYNGGAAPLTVNGITLPAGFTGDIAPGEFTVDKKSSQPLAVTVDCTVAGYLSGNLEVTYDNNGTPATYSLPLTAVVVADGTWTADFNNTSETPKWPAGSVAESGINSGSQYQSGTYNVWLTTYTSADYAVSNNKFITPKLHAEAGESMSFDVAYESTGTNCGLKIYVSADRENWGEPVAEFPANSLTSAFQNKSFTIAEAGDYYIGFAMYRVKLDNIAGFRMVEGITRDVYYTAYTLPEEVQTGTEVTPEITFIPVMDMPAADYAVKFYAGGEVRSTAEAKDYEAHAKNTKTIKFPAWAPEVEATTDFETYVQIEFADGNVFKSPVKTLRVTNEPVFVFFNKGTAAGRYKPESLKTPISFGKTNTLGLTKEYEVYNFGTAPLTVKSITLPGGFSANADGPFTVPGKERKEIILTFSATQAGVYQGPMNIVYIGADGTDQTFTLDISGTMLDPGKWYVTFGDDPEKGIWPPGSLHESNLSLTNGGTNIAPDWYASSSSATKNMMITPKLHASAGEQFSVDGRIYASNWKEGTIEVFAAATRDALADETLRTRLASLCGNNTDPATTLTADWQTFTVALPEQGDWYVGIAVSGRAQLDDLYGLTLADVAHEWLLEGTTVPETAMQNMKSTAFLKLRNIGLTDEQAGQYTLVANVDGKATEIPAAEPLTLHYTLTEEAQEVKIPFHSPKIGTFPVYFEVKAGDYKVTTEPAQVTFTQEQAAAEITVGTPGTCSTDARLLRFWDKNSTAVVLYNAEYLGQYLRDGDKINRIAFKGYIDDDITENYKLSYELTDDQTQPQPEPGEYDTSGMTALIDWTNHEFKKTGTASEPVEVIVAELEEPIVYQAGKSLRFVSRSSGTAYKKTGLLLSERSGNNFGHSSDNPGTFETQAWTDTRNLPVLYLGLDITPAELQGTVTDADDTAAEGAVVTLVSDDGDDIQYSATADAEGKYSVNVIQNSRTYTVKAEKEDRMDSAEGITLAGGSRTLDFILMRRQTISYAEPDFIPGEHNIINVCLSFPAGVNTVCLPFGMSHQEAMQMFGEGTEIFILAADDGAMPRPMLSFEKSEAGIEAGVPYMAILPQDAAGEFYAKDRRLVAEPADVTTQSVMFRGTFTEITLTEGMHMLDGIDFAPAPDTPAKAAAAKLNPFHAYIQGKPGFAPEGVTFITDTGITTGVEKVAADSFEDAVIYNLQGIRVANPGSGIYIINGKKVYLKR